MKTDNVQQEGSSITTAIVKAQEDAKGVDITREVLVDRFGDMQSQITKYDNLSMKIEITNDTTLKVCETHISTVIRIMNDIEKVRKVFKEPYFDAGKRIDEHAKKLTALFEASKKRMVQEVTTFKQMAQAKMQAEEQARREAAQLITNEKNAEVQRISRIRSQLMARIYGGVYTVASGEEKRSAGCITKADCSEMKKFLKEKYPKPDTFMHMGAASQELYDECMQLLREHYANVTEAEDDNAEKRSDALSRIQMARVEANVTSAAQEGRLSASVQKEHRREEIAIEKDVKDAGKGLRATIKFIVVDEDQVPVDMKVVSDTKVNSYLKVNKERIIAQLQKGEQPIKGLNVYVEKGFISR